MDFSELWDYRKKQRTTATTQKKEAARWLLHDDDFVAEHAESILKAARRLGFIDIAEPIYDFYDYVIALGGARFANLHRCQQAAKIIHDLKLKNCTVIALGGMRIISETERYTVDTYAPHAETEFEALCKGLEYAFYDGKKATYTDEIYIDDDINLSWCIRKFNSEFLQNNIYSVAAPSTESDRRANSMDSYEFFFQKFKLEKGSRVLFCTSSIYVPYQHVKFLLYAIEHNIQSDMIGIRDSITPNMGLGYPVNYLQEIRAAIMAMEEFVSKYCK